MKDRAPVQEDAWLEALRQYKILDIPSEQVYDDITELATFICDVPIALISLVDSDRQWFKSKVSLNVYETSHYVLFRAHTLLSESIMIVNDTLCDERFCDSQLVSYEPKIRFYAGVPLKTPDGYSLGTLCVIDHQPRELSKYQAKLLEALAHQVMIQLELKQISTRLADALDKVSLKEGLIPICSYCKGIRNDRGYWSTVEKFIKQFSNVEFTHGVCDQCMRQHFPDVASVLLSKADQDLSQDDHESSDKLLG